MKFRHGATGPRGGARAGPPRDALGHRRLEPVWDIEDSREYIALLGESGRASAVETAPTV